MGMSVSKILRVAQIALAEARAGGGANLIATPLDPAILAPGRRLT